MTFYRRTMVKVKMIVTECGIAIFMSDDGESDE
jgi:hypothetical protein